MYDFELGSSEEILANETTFLLAVKRMLPRWLNSIADSEFVALCELADAAGARRETADAVFIETGVGASTLALYWYAAKHDVTLYTWELASAKSSAIRQVLDEAFSRHTGSVGDHWRAIPWSSNSPELGIAALSEVGARCLMSFHDSDHTWTCLSEELTNLAPLLVDGAVVAVDDANLHWTQTNIGLVNTFRKKFGWPAIDPSKLPYEAEGEIHWRRVSALLNSRFESVEHLQDSYKDNFADDAYFSWYSTEFREKAALGIEVPEHLEHRFDAFRVSGLR